MVEWIDLDELLDKSIGDIREMLAHEDSDSSFRTFLIENGAVSTFSITGNSVPQTKTHLPCCSKSDIVITP